ncbi:MAG: hypothetical protein AB1894_28485 [Chloroflexota bacterium]
MSKNTSQFDTNSARRLVLALAMASTLGFWAVFSRIEADAAAVELEPQGQYESQIVYELPPMPTLVPELSVSTGAAIPTTASGQPTPTPTPGPLIFGGTTQTNNDKAGKVFFGGGKPSNKKGGAVTKTSSSK